MLNKAIKILKQGGLVVVPSDTVYGLSVDATNLDAVEKLIKFKSRPAGKPISVFVHSLFDAEKIVKIGIEQKQTLESILPGRFTVVLPSKHKIDRRLESEKGTLGIRIIGHRFIYELTKQYSNPITATSANLSGTSPHYSIESLLKSLSTKKRAMIDFIVDHGKLPYNKPSTVIDLTGDEMAILRQGELYIKHNTPGVSWLSHSEEETRMIAKNFIKEWLKRVEKKPLVIILHGELGAGKTQFVKGIGEYFGIREIISPTFVIYYEYKNLRKGFNYFYHVDLYNISEKSEFAHLGFENMLKPGNIICIEWGEKSGDIINEIEDKSNITYINLSYINENKRKIVINKK